MILVFDLRILGFRFGFSMFMGLLVEVVVVLRAVGGGGCGCGFLDLPLVVVELGFRVAGYWCVKWVSGKRDVSGY